MADNFATPTDKGDQHVYSPANHRRRWWWRWHRWRWRWRRRRRHPSRSPALKHPFIRTSLRPDYYEYFPRFTAFELVRRLGRHGPAQATLLGRHDSLSLGERFSEEDLYAVLVGVGIASQVARAGTEALRGYREHASWLMPEGVINTSFKVPDSEVTWVSAPGIIALMLTQLRGQSPKNVLEIGAGVGLHAAALLKLDPEVSYTGVEPCHAAVEEAKRILPQVIPEAGTRAHFRLGLAQHVQPEPWDLVFSTCATPANMVERLAELSSTRPVLIQTPRPLTEEEFEAEPDDSWLKESRHSYQAYLEAGRFRNYMAISLYVVDENGRHTELETLYDVSFVPFEEKHA